MWKERDSFGREGGWGLPPNVGGTVLTVGSFDGMHRGHQDILRRLARRAETADLRALLVTFEPHPLEVLNPTAAPALLTVGYEKVEIAAQTGIEYLAVLPFTRKLAALGATDFVVDVLLRRFQMRELIVGYDHGFGRGREGNAEMLREIGEREGFTVDVVEPVAAADGRPASSTLIRRAIAGGDLDTAAHGLGRPYSVSGRVHEGVRRGRVLGFPTINLGTPPPRKLLPPEGVYAVRVQTPRGPFGGMMNLGARPTFDDPTVTLEVHLFDADVDLYGLHVTVEFVARLRDTRRFASADALVEQLRRDEKRARHALTLLGRAHNVGDSSHTAIFSPQSHV